MGTAQSRTIHARSRATPPQGRPRIPDIRFRVLVIGRANAGKTSILQRVCETTESPTIYRGNEEVRDPGFCLRVGSYCP
jgi:GTPase SAR1 family protein